MFLRIVILLSILLMFFTEFKTRDAVNTYNEINKYEIEMIWRKQAWRNVNQISHSILYEVKTHREDYNEEIDEDLLFRLFAEHGVSYVGGKTGDMYVIDLRDGTMFYDNSKDVASYLELSHPKWNYEEIFQHTLPLGGDPHSMQLAWDNHLKKVIDNPPEDMVKYNFDGRDEWLVCVTLPDSTKGFNGIPSATGKSFQLKVCQGVQSDEVLVNHGKNMEKIQEHVDYIKVTFQLMIGLYILSILVDYCYKKYIVEPRKGKFINRVLTNTRDENKKLFHILREENNEERFECSVMKCEFEEVCKVKREVDNECGSCTTKCQ